MFLQIPQDQMEKLVFNTANKLLKPNNTITTLEIKLQLIKDYPQTKWVQNFVHDTMDYFYRQGLFVIVDDNGTYRTYSDPNYNPVFVDAVATPVDQIALGNGYTKSIDTSTDGTSNSSVSTVKTTIDKNKALNLMQNNRGHYFTAFVNENGTVSVLNCQYIKNQQDFNFPNSVVVKLRKKSVDTMKTFNLNELIELSINKQNFVVS